jgi:hypothetical protein
LLVFYLLIYNIGEMNSCFLFEGIVMLVALHHDNYSSFSMRTKYAVKIS